MLQGTSTTRQTLDPNLRAPYNINYLFAIERQLPKGLVGTINYSFNRGVHLFRTRNINAPKACDSTTPVGACVNGFYRPVDPTLGNISEYESAGLSRRHQISFGLSRRFSTRFTFFGNYNLAWAKDNAGTPADNYNLVSEWARTSGDRRHQLTFTPLLNLPKGIRLNGTVIINSGTPFNITTGLDDNNDTQFNDRPRDANGNIIGRNSDLPASLYAFIPQPTRIVTLPNKTQMPLIQYLTTFFPNGITALGPGSLNTNVSISKTFGFGHRDTSQNRRNQQNQQDQQGQQGQQGQQAGRGGGGGGRGGGGGFGGGGGGFGGGGGGRGGGGGGRGGGGQNGNESARFNLRLSATVNNFLNHVNFGQYSGTLGSPYLGTSSSAAQARSISFNLQFQF